MNTWSVHGKCMTGAEAHLEERWEDGVEKPGWHIAARLAVWRHCGAGIPVPWALLARLHCGLEGPSGRRLSSSAQRLAVPKRGGGSSHRVGQLNLPLP